MQEWGALTPYAFPPFILIGSAAKNETGSSVGSMFDHVWRAQPWFPLVLKMSIDSPVLIPMKEYTLTDPDQNPHSMVLSGRIQSVTCILSKAKKFQRRLQVSFSPHGGKEQKEVTSAWC